MSDLDHSHDDSEDSSHEDHCGCGHDHGHAHHDHHEDHEEPLQEPILIGENKYDVYPTDPKQIIKTITKEGSGDSPKKGSKVKVHYVGTLEDGTVFDSSRTRGDQFEFKIGMGQVIKGWDVGIATMKIGEIADFTIAGKYAYGANGSPPKIPPNATLNFNVELFSFEKDPETTEEKLEFGNAKKAAGNECIKKQTWHSAIREYDSAISMCRYLFCSSDELKKQHKDLMLALHLNKALSCLKVNLLNECVTCCNDALTLDSANPKAFFRRGSAYRLRGEFELAFADLTQAAKLAPTDRAIRDELVKAQEAQRKRKEKEKATYSNVFEKLQAMQAQEEKEKQAKKEKEEQEAKARKAREEKEKLEREEQEKKEREAKEKEAEKPPEEKKEGDDKPEVLTEKSE